MCTILRVFTKIVYKNLSKTFKNSAAILNSTFFFKFLAQCESIYIIGVLMMKKTTSHKGRTTASTKVFLPSLHLAGAF